MFQVLASTWALLFGILLLLVGNGLQGTLLGIRGGLEGFSTFSMSIIMSAYFVGFLGGSQTTPWLIRRVGHIRVFAAYGSFVSAILVLYPLFPNPIAWALFRVAMGFCLSGVYVTAESWLNNSVTNERRGQALSLYLIVQMAGIVAAQGLMLVADPAGFALFIIPSVLVSISFAPILLAVTPTPAFETTRPMRIAKLWQISPLGCVGVLLMGGVFSATFGMASVYGSQAGLSVAQISGFIATIYMGGMVLQYPIGWLSDRMDRRLLILLTAALCALASLLGMIFGGDYWALLAAGFLIGGSSNPLYALLLAYTNDRLTTDDMAGASGGMLFLNGIGAIMGPLATGWIMTATGPQGFFLLLTVLCATMALYAAWRMTRTSAVPVDDTGHYPPVLPSATAVVVDAAREVFLDSAQDGGVGNTGD
ncbi:MFS transporter [Tropicimonas sp. IMCC34043]|uniref:MFS transporter n=1 Tax=Tropicimonas sp. IMCC34043 TaxID=2248760 RepID=UPI000E26E298|nr:MFS transporter [Tropicimonas sp. IMCC34043]